MRMDRLFEKFRFYTAAVGLGLGASIFWGALAAVIAKLVFDLGETSAWLFIGLPTAVVFLVWIWKKLPKVLGVGDENRLP